MMTHIITMGSHTMHLHKPIAMYGADKVILVYSLDLNSYNTPEMNKKITEDVENALSKAETIYETLGIKYEKVLVDGELFEENLEKFRELMKKEEKIILNLTGGRKLISFALLYAALYEPKNIEKIIFVGDSEKIVSFPKILGTLKITALEEKILSKLSNGEKTVSELANELGVSLPAVVKYLNGLEEKKLIKSEKIGRNRYVKLF